jgi:hypothetical protein
VKMVAGTGCRDGLQEVPDIRADTEVTNSPDIDCNIHEAFESACG